MAASGGDVEMSSGDEFVLGAEVKHDQDIRCVCPFPDAPGGFLTASYDKTVRSWTTLSGGEAQLVSTFAGHQGWVSAVAYAKEGFAAGDPRPTIASASWDKHIILWNPESCQPEWVLAGHEDKVSCIAPIKGGFATGGYDKLVLLWRGGHLAATLTGHCSPVSCCCGLPSGEVVSGGAHGDNSLIRWSADGRKLAQYGPGGPGKSGHTSGVRAVAAANALSGGDFISASNDTLLILWSLAGAPLRTLVGHANQVYCVACLPTGEFVSGSEDKTVKVWRGADCVQTIKHPSFTFGVCALDNGDIVTGGTDAVARVWTRDPGRAAPEGKQKAYEETLAAKAVAKGGLSGLERDKLPGPEALNTPGQADGQQRIIRRGEGAEVYLWSAAQSKWEKLGDVQDGPGQTVGGGEGIAVGGPSGQKLPHNGQMWDYVFDVDLRGDGSGYFKLPYNKGENPYMAAQRFIHSYAEQGVGQHFLDEIARFIIQNADTGTNQAAADQGQYASEYAREAAQAAAAGAGHTMSNWEALQQMQQGGAGDVAFSEYAKEQAQLKQQGGVAAQSAEDIRRQIGDSEVAFSRFAQEGQQIAGGALPTAAAPTASGLPEGYVVNTKTAYDKMKQRLAQLNGELAAALPAPQFAQLTALVDAAAVGAVGGCSAASLPPLAQLLATWPAGQRVAGLDLLKQLVASEAGAQLVIETDKSGAAPALQLALSWLAPDGGATQGAAQGPEVMLCGRIAANLFASPRGRAEVVARAPTLLPAAQKVWQTQGNPLNARRALVDLLLNFCVYCATDPAGGAEQGLARELVSILCTGLLFEDDASLFADIVAALARLMLNPSKVSAAASAAGREFYLSDTLRAKPGPTPQCKQLIELLQEALRPV
eukprot:TRINITY_DN65525_c0_g1_i1.p1 TRINITY_DN65525_c0_g1~~TRINITY_DN65525_c0_g1_i1.p1  ORF type:complete len:900 (+),score=309.45 TRINITY_DN65525_c0_g1_i1:71-2701(+)